MNAILLVILGLVVSNIAFVYLVFYYVNRNWENILDLKNQINTLQIMLSERLRK